MMVKRPVILAEYGPYRVERENFGDTRLFIVRVMSPAPYRTWVTVASYRSERRARYIARCLDHNKTMDDIGITFERR